MKGYRALICDHCGETFYQDLSKKGVPTTRWCSEEHKKEFASARGKAQREDLLRLKKAEERARAAALDALCGEDHRTWRSKAECMWPGVQVEGEGPLAVWDGEVLRLYPKGTQVVRLHRGLHKRGVVGT